LQQVICSYSLNRQSDRVTLSHNKYNNTQNFLETKTGTLAFMLVIPLRSSTETEMHHPDELLHESQMSLKQFVQISEYLFSQEDTPDNLIRFVRFVLAGRFDFDGSQTRIFINARQDASPPPIHKYQLHRDLDSANGITRDLPFRTALAIFPLASFRDTLTKDNHMKYQSSALSGPRVSFCIEPGFRANCV
jgi:hypothetical protein